MWSWYNNFSVFFFVAAALMLLAGNFMAGPGEASNRIAPRHQALMYAAVFALAGLVFLVLAIT